MSSNHHNDEGHLGDTSPSKRETSDPIIEKRSPATLAHELANLIDAGMRNVGLAMSSLRDTRPSSEGAKTGGIDPIERLESVSQAMRQMGRLLGRWGDYDSRLHSGSNLDDTVEQTVRHVVNLFRPVAGQYGIKVHVCLSAAAAKLPAGPMYSVVANALRNSVEAMQGNGCRSQGVIELNVRVKDSQVELCIADNGPGLDRKLVDAKGQFCFGVTTKSGGHGLGLALLRQICDGLGGTIEVRNAPAGGAVLCLRYPVNAIQR